MKKIITLILIAFTINANAQQLIKAEIVATGLTCSMCSNAIYKQLKSTDGIDSVKIDLNNNQFIVFLNKNNTIDPNILKGKIEKAGFFVGSFVAYLNIQNLVAEDNKQIGNYVFVDTKTQNINGIAKVKIVNKGFITTKEFKKLQLQYLKYSSYNKTENFHIKLI